MSVTHLSLVREIDDLKGPARSVLNVLADRADEKGMAWPSWKTLQRDSGFGRSTVHAALRELHQRGLVCWEHRRDDAGDLTSNLYRLTLPSPPDKPGGPGSGRGSPPAGLPSPGAGLGVVRELDGGSPGAGRRSIIEAPEGSTNEESISSSPMVSPGEPLGELKLQIEEPPLKPDVIAEAIYQRYPRKEGKSDAIKAILKAMKRHDAKFLIERTEAYAEAIAWKERQFIPHPATWFNGERFNDDPEAWKEPAPTARNGKAPIAEDEIDRLLGRRSPNFMPDHREEKKAREWPEPPITKLPRL